MKSGERFEEKYLHRDLTPTGTQANRAISIDILLSFRVAIEPRRRSRAGKAVAHASWFPC
jgi:hypothetical protein